MKIGIFTFFQTNYGAILQAYSLQKYLLEQPGVDAEIIDFTTSKHLESNKIFQKQKSGNIISKIAYLFFTCLRFPQLKKREKRTQSFKDKYLRFSKRYSTIDDLLRNHPTEDVYITGSDQVFRLDSPYMPVYYLGFNKVNGKKVAYAPSFGSSVFSEQIETSIRTYVEDFDFLSCRESSGATFLQSILGRKVPVVLDPVFLRTGEDWSKIAITPSFAGEYIFVYDLNGGYDLINLANKIKEKTNLPIVCLTRVHTRFYKVDKQCYDAGPAEFLGWIKNASFVVTDSFHGTAFSIIFNRAFFSYIALEKSSVRLKELLGKVGLENRLLTKKQLPTFDVMTYDSIPAINLDEFSLESKMFIQKFLNE